MNTRVSNHYDNSYFDWQAPIGKFGGWANASKFAGYIRPGDAVLDFGCGGGWLLKNLDCGRRMGIEVNETAAQAARGNGVEVFAGAAQAPDHAADVLISNHALEHTLDPLRELQTLRSKLRPGGKVIFVVPCETLAVAYQPGDISHHLYSWSPMSLGNLFEEAGYAVIESKPYLHRWPPQYRLIARLGGRRLFHLVSGIYGRLNRTQGQVRLIANVKA